MTVIGVSGKKRSGKDTFFQMLEKHSSVPVYRLAFADTLKNEIYEMILKPDGLERSMLDNDETKEQFRILLQWWGTEYRRRLFRDDYWLVKLSEQLEPYKDQDVIVVVTDVRFPNEFNFIKSIGGLMVRISRPGLTSSTDSHVSEIALDDEKGFDTFVDNNGTLEQFESIVQAYIGALNRGASCLRMVSVV
jgi:hypothetical protein